MANNPLSAAALMVRHPVPGKVKSRLSRDIGDTRACELYKAMVADAVANIRKSLLPLFLFHDGLQGKAPPDEWLEAADGVYSQEGDTLGERITAAFMLLFADGFEKVILTGSDIPGIDAPLLQSAIEALDCCDVVFSPAHDGGYSLVAFRKGGFSSAIFQNIKWSTEHVFEDTLNICSSENLSCTLLDYRQDIDTLSDLHAYCRNVSPSAFATNVWLTLNGYY